MPRLARLYVKVGLVWLVIGMILGIALAAARAGMSSTWVLVLAPTWVHLLTVGWLTQLIFGVALWMFPRFSREDPFGRLELAWAAFWMLNAGLLLRIAGEAAIKHGAGPLLVVSALLQLFGALLFAAYIWPRVRSR